MARYMVRVPIVEVYEIEVEADSPAEAIAKIEESDTDYTEGADRVDSYWLDIDEDMDVTELIDNEGV